MDRRRATLGVAAVGVVAGVVGLVVMATPAGAGPAPSLPPVTARALVQSVLTANPPAMSGTVTIENNLGLPPIPGIPELQSDSSELRVWSDGTGRSRLSIPTVGAEKTYVDSGSMLYEWDSTTHAVTEVPLHQRSGDASAGKHQPEASMTPTDPASAAKALVAAVQSSSTISVDGTDMVAGQPAYDLVLTPKANERTLLRQVRIAVDATHHIPLQLTVLADNSAAPAIQVGFSSIDYGMQDASLFQFTPPANATVTKDNGDKDRAPADRSEAVKDQPTLVGSGWDTVLVITLPKSLDGTQPTGGTNSGVTGLMSTLGTPVHGSWGSGWAISTSVGTAIVTSDGRIAVGFVPQQVVTQALGNAR